VTRAINNESKDIASQREASDNTRCSLKSVEDRNKLRAETNRMNIMNRRGINLGV